MHNIGESLRELREERDLKQKEVADALFISNKLLSSYERGISQPPIDMLIRICEYYQVSADTLLGLWEDEEAGEAGEIGENGVPTGTEFSGDETREGARMPGAPTSAENAGPTGAHAPVVGSREGSRPVSGEVYGLESAEDRRILGYYHRLDAESQEAIRGLLIYYCKEQEHRRALREAAEE